MVTSTSVTVMHVMLQRCGSYWCDINVTGAKAAETVNVCVMPLLPLPLSVLQLAIRADSDTRGFAVSHHTSF